MAPLPGTPKESPKPQPIGYMPIVFLITTCTICALFLLWRRADLLRKAVSHRLKTFTTSEGRIRLSEDDGPAATEFLGEDYDDDNEHLNMNVNSPGDDDTLSEQMKRMTRVWSEPSVVPVEDGLTTAQAQSTTLPASPSRNAATARLP